MTSFVLQLCDEKKNRNFFFALLCFRHIKNDNESATFNGMIIKLHNC